MKNENTTNAICGHTRIDHTSLKFADELVPCWVCSCKSFTTATSGESEVEAGTFGTAEEAVKNLRAVLFADARKWILENDHHLLPLAGEDDMSHHVRILVMHAYHVHFEVLTDQATQIRELKLERDSLKRKVEAAKGALTGMYRNAECTMCTYNRKMSVAALKELESPG